MRATYPVILIVSMLRGAARLGVCGGLLAFLNLKPIARIPPDTAAEWWSVVAVSIASNAAVGAGLAAVFGLFFVLRPHRTYTRFPSTFMMPGFQRPLVDSLEDARAVLAGLIPSAILAIPFVLLLYPRLEIDGITERYSSIMPAIISVIIISALGAELCHWASKHLGR
jgi:hypothetical protein